MAEVFNPGKAEKFIVDGREYEKDQDKFREVNGSVAVKEYVLNGRTFQFNEADAKRLGAKPLNRATKIPLGEMAEKPTKKDGKKDADR